MNNSNQFPLSRQQKNIIFHNTKRENNLRSRCVLRLNETIEFEHLKQCVNKIFLNHETFCTSFNRSNDGIILNQQVNECVRIEWDEKLWKESSPSVQIAPHELYELHQSLTDDTLIAITLVTTTIQKQPDDQNETQGPRFLLVDFSSLLADYKTLKNFYYALELTLNNKSSDEDILQYVDFSIWQDDFVDDDTIAKQYWNEEKTHQSTIKFAGELAVAETDLSDKQYARLNDRISQLITQEELLTAWLFLLHQFSGNTQVGTHVIHDGRMSEELQVCMGAFSNAVWVNVNLEKIKQFSELVTQVKDVLESSYDNQMSCPLSSEQYFDHQLLFEYQSTLSSNGAEAKTLDWLLGQSEMSDYRLKLTSLVKTVNVCRNLSC